MAAEENDPMLHEEPMPEGKELPPRGVFAMGLVRWVFVLAAAGLAAFMWLSYARTTLSTAQPSAGARAAQYHCPMHPQIVSDTPGECPICHMTLEPIASERSAPPLPTSTSATPHVHTSADGAMVTDASAPVPGATPPGTTPVKLALDRIQSIGVRTAVAEERAFGAPLRVTAIVTAPEQGVSEVHVHTAGFVEAMHVAETGRAVRAGQPMLAVYSPEILQAENELLATAAWSGDAGAATTSAARRKLELLGMAPAEIDRVVATREPLRAITISAPRGGVVTKKGVVLGSYVTPEMVLFEVQDLSKVYVVADVLLADVSAVAVGAEGRFVPSAHPERAVTAKVDLLYPLANAEARTRRARLLFTNDPKTPFVPGEYGTVELTATPRRGVSIPRDAVIDTGGATYVFVVEPEGRFIPRIVALGGSDADRLLVNAGLATGERVVSGATFLIDSESRLQASIALSVQTPSSPSQAPSGADPSCAADFDRQTMADKWAECMKCETVHRGMGSMEGDCKRAIPRPWR